MMMTMKCVCVRLLSPLYLTDDSPSFPLLWPQDSDNVAEGEFVDPETEPVPSPVVTGYEGYGDAAGIIPPMLEEVCPCVCVCVYVLIPNSHVSASTLRKEPVSRSTWTRPRQSISLLPNRLPCG